MSRFRISKSTLAGSIEIPPSKSHTLRAILFASMAKGNSEIAHYLPSPDTLAMIDAMQNFGAQIDLFQNRLRIKGLAGKLKPAENVIDAGNSGLVLRLVGALAGLSSTYTVLTGDHSIRHRRPVKPLLEALSQLGAFATSTRLDHHAPILIKGPIQCGTAHLDGRDSQPVSGLLIATSFLHGTTTLTVSEPREKPWIDLTLFWLKKMGISIAHQNYTHYTIPGNNHIDNFSYSVPGDWSSAAFPLAAALITQSELTLAPIDLHDVQGDKKVVEILQAMGAQLTLDDRKKTLHVHKGPPLRGISLDVAECIDALPILAVIGCFAEGETKITGALMARHKESDRIHAIATELKKMGAHIEELQDGLIISHSPLTGAHLESHSDHRIAMALSVAAMGASSTSTLEGTEWIDKTYPGFLQAFQTLGAAIEETL